ncbi:regulation of nuclear pre-mRNA domain-containing protein 1A isoform X3 [Rhodamnia argentea]|uniref:Regulation of nuclear pre-mRNA domain-containing protein 1A isoform X3 n=1 Tax=Rhodamnia argentea TaxID=178133 RepID=A0ABM3GVB4_9MYRT|nr:regulation of nuclear pre-mRNA domain-containing protein 1A isoform X3 [Rhodamnia argentea]
MNSVFSEQILADKLSKLNSTQQCIETLSHWCIFHRSKAELVVATWDKQFHNSEMVQKVPLLYLANDILQNSKRKGNEFVNEFWKVLPAALKDVVEKGDDHGKNVVSRLVGIWEERRVFGSRAQSLKDLMLGEDILPPLELNRKRSRSVKIVKRDSRSIRTKLSIGSTAEKIVSAIHLVLSEHPNEDVEMSNCKSAVHRVRKMEKDVDLACVTAKDPKRRTLAKELENEENTLKQCVEKLKSVEASRGLLVSHLKEALHEQESELENVLTQMQVAQAQAEEAESMRKRLMDEDYIFKSPTSATQGLDINAKGGQTPKRTAAAIAAEVADKLTASSSSQLIMSSVLSTFAAEEAKSAGHTKSSNKSDKTIPASDVSAFMPSQPHATHSYQAVIVNQQNIQQNQGSVSQSPYLLPNQPPQQYLQQPSGAMMPSYGYVNFPTMSAGPPPSPHVLSAVVPLSQQSLPMAQKQSMVLSQQQVPLTPQQPMPLSQQPPIPPSFRPLQPPSMVYYSHQHHSQ